MFTSLLFSSLPKAQTVGTKHAVSAEWLNNKLGSHDVIIYDTRPTEEYILGHIPGAISFPVSDTYMVNNDIYYVKDKNKITPLLQSKGLNKRKLVVLYDDGRLLDAARMFWVMELYGHNNIAILDVGFKQWRKNYSYTRQVSMPIRSNYLPVFNSDTYASTMVAKVATYSLDYQLYDSRTLSEFKGNRSVTHVYGHIPRARHLSIADFFVSTNEGETILKPQNELLELFSSLDKSKKNITYCNRGKAATLSYYLLKRSGFDVAHYDGSWLDWSANNLPTEK
ncbi:sulfurtransferase [Photobacterium sp. SDRW27]|uniref:sulfurtransferase n=1 Tax=Photobacterium obscurum TaxID=2829490 RepID=UPI002243B0E0|nr:rhodanese-like domain-containing protein [Photobacterium obscurum]MCW8327888.1 sulfurtransferase [Photobacterium obscurum]